MSILIYFLDKGKSISVEHENIFNGKYICSG